MFTQKYLTLFWILVGLHNFVDSSIDLSLKTDELLKRICDLDVTAVEVIVGEVEREHKNVTHFLNRISVTPHSLESDPCIWRSALHCAVEKRSLEIVEFLVKKGADINKRSTRFIVDHDYHTALEIAAAYGYIDIAKYLLNLGATTLVQGKHHEKAPLHYAIEYDRKDMVDLILKHHVDAPDTNGNTLLYYAVQMGNIKMIQKLLNAGANINLVNEKEGYNALHALNYPRQNIEAVVNLLITHGAELEGKAANGESPLKHAILRNRFEIAKVLIGHNASLELSYLKKNSSHDTPLFSAVKMGDVVMAAMFLKAGANVSESSGARGYSALHAAAMTTKNVELLVRLLLSYGANLEQTSTDGKTPMCTAVDSRNSEAELVLFQFGAKLCE